MSQKKCFDSPPPECRILAGTYPKGGGSTVSLDRIGSESQSGKYYNFFHNYGATSDPTRVLLIGACPACRIGTLENEYSCASLCFVFCCFPYGLGKRRRCNNCTAYFQ